MKSICVYCGSANQASPKYFQAARRMGETLARAGLTLVYGGGRTGLMGALADSVLDTGGQVFGVITESMNTPELVHTRLTSLEVTATIHQRKARMYALADGYIALPGGYGTLDELFETLTWAQIGEHQKPVGILNVDGYYDSALENARSRRSRKIALPRTPRLIVMRKRTRETFGINGCPPLSAGGDGEMDAAGLTIKNSGCRPALGVRYHAPQPFKWLSSTNSDFQPKAPE